MALFDKEQEAQQQETEASAKMEAQHNENYFDAYEGQGLEGFTPETTGVAYLGMIQPDSTAAQENAPGQWLNTATGEALGPEVEVIPIAFKTVWTERDKEPPFMTVGRYEPNSIEVDVQRPKPGQRGFPKMCNPQTGNEVQELFIYAVLLKDNPEFGILYFSPTVGSMKTCKKWNGLLRAQRLPNGKIAPIFAFSWKLRLDLVNNPKQPTKKITRLIAVTRGEIVAKDLFMQAVQPTLSQAGDIMLLAAPENSGDTEEA